MSVASRKIAERAAARAAAQGTAEETAALLGEEVAGEAIGEAALVGGEIAGETALIAGGETALVAGGEAALVGGELAAVLAGETALAASNGFVNPVFDAILIATITGAGIAGANGLVSGAFLKEKDVKNSTQYEGETIEFTNAENLQEQKDIVAEAHQKLREDHSFLNSIQKS